MNNYICPICGFPGLDTPANDIACFDICSCCGFHFHVTDDDLGFTYEGWRNMWIAKGMPWDDGYSEPPSGWNPKEQLKNISIYLP